MSDHALYVLKNPMPDVVPEANALRPSAAAAPARRHKLWELEEKHHCPVIGTCINIAELQRLARRFAFAADPHDEFALHVEAVNRSMQREPFAEVVHKHLEKKYALTVKCFERADNDLAVRSLWRACLERGEVAAPLWALMTHRHASPATRHFAYADIHMLSHQVGAGQAADVRRLAWLESAHAEQERLLASERREAHRRHHELLQRCVDKDARLLRLTGAAEEAKRLQEQLAAFENGTAIVDMGRRLFSLEQHNEHLRSENTRLADVDARLADLGIDNERLRQENIQLTQELDAHERLFLKLPVAPPIEVHAADFAGDCASACPLPTSERSGPRCVLCVGGRTALVGQYQALAKRIGIRLVHHDGGQEESLSRLPDMIAGADAVICPTDAVSHAAYFQIKQQCQRRDKPCLLYKGASVSSFAVALERLVGGAASLGMRQSVHAEDDAPVSLRIANPS
jgi:hypothetical protein